MVEEIQDLSLKEVMAQSQPSNKKALETEDTESWLRKRKRAESGPEDDLKEDGLSTTEQGEGVAGNVSKKLTKLKKIIS